MNRRCLLSFLLALAVIAPGVIAQGEGNMRDAVLSSGVNASPVSTSDKALAVGDILTLEVSSSSLLANGTAIAYGSLSCTAPLPGFNFGSETGIIGLPLPNVGIFIDGIGSFPPVVIGPSGALSFSAVVPAGFVGLTGAEDLVFQAAVADPGAPNGFAVTNSIRHKGASNWQETCFDALICNGGGFNDSHLGQSITVDTTLFADDDDVDDPNVGGGTSTNFTIVPAGLGTTLGSGPSPDASAVFVANAGGNYFFDLCNSSYDTRFWLRPFLCFFPTGIIYNDDAPACPGFQSQVSVCLNPSESIIMTVDGWQGDAGLADIVITRQPFGVNGISPMSGLFLGGETVTITGACMSNVTSVTFDGIPATNVTVVDGNTVTCETPGHAPGVVDVSISDGVETETLAGAYTYSTGVFTTTINPGTGPGQLDDDDFEEVMLRDPINFCGNPYSSLFIGSNGQITFAAGDTDFSPSLGEFFAGFQASPTPMGMANPGVAPLWSDYNRGPGNSGGTWEIIEDAIAGTVTVNVNNQEFWGSQTAMGSVSATFDNVAGNVSIDLTNVVSTGVAPADKDPIIGVTDGDDQVGTDTVIDFGTMLPYTSPGNGDSVAQQLTAGDPVPAASLSFTENGTCNWSIM